MDNTKVREHIKAVETAVEHIAFVRRMAETVGVDMEEFDKELDKLCTKYHDMYAGMGELELALKGMIDIVKAGKGKELMADLFGTKEGSKDGDI